MRRSEGSRNTPGLIFGEFELALGRARPKGADRGQSIPPAAGFRFPEP